MALSAHDEAVDPRTEAERETLSTLVGWARDAVANSGRYGVSVRCDRDGPLFAAPWRNAETFFSNSSGIASIDGDADIGPFLDAMAGTPLCYGYPVRVDRRGLITPLFYCDVTVEKDGNGGWTVRKAPHRRPRLHRRLLVEAGFDRASADRITDFVEHTGFDSLPDCLAQTARVLGVKADWLRSDGLDVADATPLRPGWYRTPILFGSPEPDSHRRLAWELDELEAAYAASQGRTPLHVLLDRVQPRLKPSGAETLAIFPLSEDQPQVIDRASAAPLAVVEAPPGTNRMALLANVIATVAAENQSVLFVSPSANFLEQIAGRLQTILARQERWIMTLGAEDLRQRLVTTLGAHRRRMAVEGSSRSVDRPSFQQLKKPGTDLRSTMEPLRRGHHLWTTRLRTRLTLSNSVDGNWVILADPEVPLRLSREEAEEWRQTATSLASPRQKSGVSRLLRRGGDEAPRQNLIDAYRQAVSQVPPDKRARLPLDPATLRDDPDAEQKLADAFEALVHVIELRRAINAERQAMEIVGRAPTAAMLDDQLVTAEEAVVRASRDLFRDAMRRQLAHMLQGGETKIEAFFDAVEERMARSDRPDPRADATLARQVSALNRGYPIWTARAETVSKMLPLVGQLFDLVIVDDADRLTAPELLPLLLRGRRGVVVGVSQTMQPDQTRTDGLMIAASTPAAVRHTLTANGRSHPLIVEYLSETFHGGRLQPQVDFGALRRGYPPAAMGIQWHDIADDVGPGWETELAGAISLLHDWAEAEIFSVPEPRTVGIVTPQRDRADVLARNLDGMMPADLSLDRVAVGTPERFHGQAVDLMIILPGLTDSMPVEQVERLANDRALYHDAVAAARVGVHVVGNSKICRAAGGMVASLFHYTTFPNASPAVGEGETLPGNPMVRLGALLDYLNLCYRPQGNGFRVYSRFGAIYLVTLTTAADDTPIESEEPPTTSGAQEIAIPVEAEEVLRSPQRVMRRLERLI